MTNTEMCVLSESVAKAMGWKQSPVCGIFWSMSAQQASWSSYKYKLPNFVSDMCTIGILLEWLDQRGVSLTIYHARSGPGYPSGYTTTLMHDGQYPFAYGGNTIGESLCIAILGYSTVAAEESPKEKTK